MQARDVQHLGKGPIQMSTYLGGPIGTRRDLGEVFLELDPTIVEQDQAIFWTTPYPIFAQGFNRVDQLVVQEPTIEKNNAERDAQLGCTLYQLCRQAGFGAIELFAREKSQQISQVLPIRDHIRLPFNA